MTTTRTRTGNATGLPAAIGLGAAALGIVTQIVGGVDYPVVPPGLLILIAAAAFVWLAPWRWTPVVGLAVSVFMLIGFAANPDSLVRLVAPQNVLACAGTWLQLLAVLAVAALSGRDVLRR